ncbi:hypothetical protein Micbo1qcDRAFT_159265 [Microdochium bolleyi]|uniref:Elongator complex protein 6 n=1 Tax=Microdochium bolleyi TaxID=196109 RepID=A0A136JAQ1_9PEZI|nr:hypothetical protein Micbo1qcDRAFT_159265 [Microdochium bolleyi]
MATRIPHLLEPYLCLPAESSLILLTGVLGASTNWLVLRYLYSLLANANSTSGHQSLEANGGAETGLLEDRQQPVKVVLLSFLRDYAFWRDNAARLGVDLDSAASKARFVYVDGLSGLFSGGEQNSTAGSLPAAPGVRGAAPGSSGAGRLTLNEPTVLALRNVLDQAIAQKPTGSSQIASTRTVLVVDQIDLLVAASGDESLRSGLSDVLLDIREKVHSSIFTLSADEPLIQAQTTPLEKKHAALVLSTAHAADLVMSVRLLDTGSARDVSGVLRVTAGGSGGDSGEAEADERELLYYIGGDGAARVFERGQ